MIAYRTHTNLYPAGKILSIGTTATEVK